MNIRKSIFFILAFLITANCLAIQDKEWAGDLFPKDFEKFALEKHTIINGNLMVYNSTIKDLHLLESLEVVKGNVQIGIYDYKKDIKAGNDLIETLNGLQNLTTISGSLVIRENKVLKNISALKNLKTVHNISISYNPYIISLDGLQNLSGKLKGGISLYRNKRLQDITQLAGITEVRDHLTINSHLSLLSLKGVHNIKTVNNGYLAVRSNTNLKDLKGLRNIKRVEGEVQITTNPEIIDLKGLEKLEFVGEFFYIKENQKLESLNGLKSLKIITEDFTIEKNNKLTSLDGLKKLTTIKGNLSIEKNPKLSDINGINQLKDTIGKSIFILDNISLKQITGLNNIIAVKESLVLSKNHLEEVTGFKNLKTIGENLSLRLNHIQVLSGFNNLTRIENFGIGSEIAVIDFTKSFKKLTSIKGFFLFTNKTLESFKGLNAVTEIDKITIKENEKLVSFSGFNGLKTIKGKLIFEKNTQLKKIEGFNSLETIGSINIDDNPVLESIKGFEKIDFIDYIWIDENPELSDLSGFRNLKSANEIYLRRNYDLEDLTGFSSLEKVNEELDLHYNSELKSLNGLENLMFIGKQLDFTHNKKLIDYNALQESFIQSISDDNLRISNNGYNPYKNGLLIHNKLDTKLIPEEYLKPKSRWWLSLLRNEIFARKGFVFGKQELTDYFNEQGWYKPDDGVEIVLNEIEEENVRLIKMYEKLHIDMATNAILNLKKQYKDNVNFSSDYNAYYKILRKFIKDIDVHSLAKSNKLSFSKISDFDKNVLGVERYNDDELDNISIHFDSTKKSFHIIIKDNYLEEDNYDSWLVNKIIDFKFRIKDDLTVEFSEAKGSYN